MAENRFPNSSCAPKETVCIETNRVLDSCRDRDCFENVRVYLSAVGNEILERTGAIRARRANIIWTYIGIDPIQFNRGFYSVIIRFYVKVELEACVGAGHPQELCGIAVLEKRVILFGGESETSIYRSNAKCGSFCALPEPTGCERNVPSAIVEVVEPVLLGTRIFEKPHECNCNCCCQENELPEPVLTSFDSPIEFDDSLAVEGNGRRYLTVSLGIFSVVRIVRPGQFLVQATEYNIPEKECTPVCEDDPCHVFRSMPFPAAEFGAQCVPIADDGCGCHERPAHRCGCGN